MSQMHLDRRGLLRAAAGGVLGLSLAEFLSLRDSSASAASTSGNAVPFGRAKSCIVLFAWGGMSHLDTWDMKPLAGSDVRGEFQPIETSVPGILLSQHMPNIAARAEKLAIVRSVHHGAAAHRAAAYWNITGHSPRVLGNVVPSRNDWPSLGSMVWHAKQQRDGRGGMPGSVSLPYPIADSGLVNGQFGGILGDDFAPVYVKPQQGRPYNGVSPETRQLTLDPIAEVDASRMASRRSLVAQLEGMQSRVPPTHSADALIVADQYRDQAYRMMSASAVREAFDLAREPERITRGLRQPHLRTKRAAGAPLDRRRRTAGHRLLRRWRFERQHRRPLGYAQRQFQPLEKRLAAAARPRQRRAARRFRRVGQARRNARRLDDRIRRTPKLGGNGRDHYPNCYSVAFAGAGVRGGQVFGRSDKIGSEPASNAVGPEHLHATIFRALGIDPHKPSPTSLAAHDSCAKPNRCPWRSGWHALVFMSMRIEVYVLPTHMLTRTRACHPGHRVR